jgi:hypothetical protein
VVALFAPRTPGKHTSAYVAPKPPVQAPTRRHVHPAPIDGEDTALVRPYLVAFEAQREREQRHLRRTLLIMASLEMAIAL